MAIVLVGATLFACGKDKKETVGSDKASQPHPIAGPVAAPKLSAPKAPVSKRPSDHDGVVFVGEWHHIAVGKTTMHRSPTAFRGDLDRLYKMGFRPVTAQEWLGDKMDLAKGASPVVMTFDDSDPDQFKLLDDGTVDPKCGVGIWLDFAKTHPDFPVKGTFFVLPNMWSQPKWIKKKLEMLHGWGSEIANHTITHVALRHQTDERVKKEIGDAAIALAKLGEKGPFDVAYPFGSTPKNTVLLKGFPYKGGKITVASGFLVGANPSVPPTAKGFDRYHIARIQATTGDWGLDYWLDKAAAGKVKLYVE